MKEFWKKMLAIALLLHLSISLAADDENYQGDDESYSEDIEEGESNEEYHQEDYRQNDEEYQKEFTL